MSSRSCASPFTVCGDADGLADEHDRPRHEHGALRCLGGPGARLFECVVERLDDALEEARTWAAEAPKRAVLVTGSIVLVGEAIAIADDREWGMA